jgi:hypothetical protein
VGEVGLTAGKRDQPKSLQQQNGMWMVSVIEAGSSDREIMMLGLSSWQQPFSAA